MSTALVKKEEDNGRSRSIVAREGKFKGNKKAKKAKKAKEVKKAKKARRAQQRVAETSRRSMAGDGSVDVSHGADELGRIGLGAERYAS